MEQRTIKIEFSEHMTLDLSQKNQLAFKIQLVDKIKEVLNETDIEDYFVYDSANVQEIILKIDNKKSDQ